MADYRAVLTAVSALGANQREHAGQLRDHGQQLRENAQQLRDLARQQADTNTRVRSIEDNLGEVKDLLVRALER